jgi:hypothetical protein
MAAITIKKMPDTELKTLENNIVRRLLELKNSNVAWKETETKTLEEKLVEVLEEGDSRASKCK